MFPMADRWRMDGLHRLLDGGWSASFDGCSASFDGCSASIRLQIDT
eukprot:CAMPEP_0197520744 /NCGR_PEP_ID=MMETSP1318-20131121/6071_1 /TAXON_ID=552666 /ORGANISM="Partenskyella glossopodia, Strain RCC365" /LENGTH=45 /DNA_ID= /DNA_START= /DNA_END= /DNA_ORIENTATION=